MATPHVAGAAAILCAAFPNETASQIKSRILSGANRNYGVSNGYWANGTLDVYASRRLPTPVRITTSTLPGGTVGTLYTQRIYATGAGNITCSIQSGNLPSGLSLSGTGTISGRPTVSGAFNFTLKAKNSTTFTTKIFDIIITQ